MNGIKNFLDKITAMLGGERALSNITRSSDIILSVMMVTIIGMMILPLPTAVISFCIAANLAIALMLLLVSLYIPSAVHLSIFPSLLLVTTLFRLGINISTTRSILLNADGGEIIQAFGDFVVAGNFVVGGVIFLIITIVQFLVITKGAERVAEVAARFTLDAMPGKQMAIDADLRAGMLDQTQARQKREAIQKESQLYGAMDGAMKFVKGDAIAGIVITLINVVGGLIIGMMQHGMTALEAAQVFSLLSIGDGLVSQIPALLIAITAGIVTTRVSSDDPKANLGSDISGQMMRQPKALLIASVVLVLLAMVPAFPAAPFLGIALVVGIIAYSLIRSKEMRSRGGGMTSASGTKGPSPVMETEVEGHSAVTGGGIDSYQLTLPIIVELGAHLSVEVNKRTRTADFMNEMIPRMRQALYNELGIRFPGVHVRTESPTLETEDYAILLNEVPVIRGKVLQGYVLTNESAENLKRYNLPFTTYKNSLGLPSLWVESSHEELMKRAGIQYWSSLEVTVLHLTHFFRQYANEFLGIQEVKGILEFMEKSFPDLVKEVTRLIPLQKLTDIFKRLTQEQISIKDLRTVLEALAEWAQTEKDTVLLTEYVRSSLKRYISYKYSQGQTVLSVYILDPEIEDMIRGAIKQTSAGSYLALDPDSVQLILQGIRNTVTAPPAGGQVPVMLTAIDVRRFVRKLIEMEFPDISVVSYQEIIPEIRIQPLGRIQIS